MKAFAEIVNIQMIVGRISLYVISARYSQPNTVCEWAFGKHEKDMPDDLLLRTMRVSPALQTTALPIHHDMLKTPTALLRRPNPIQDQHRGDQNQHSPPLHPAIRQTLVHPNMLGMDRNHLRLYNRHRILEYLPMLASRVRIQQNHPRHLHRHDGVLVRQCRIQHLKRFGYNRPPCPSDKQAAITA